MIPPGAVLLRPTQQRAHPEVAGVLWDKDLKRLAWGAPACASSTAYVTFRNSCPPPPGSGHPHLSCGFVIWEPGPGDGWLLWHLAKQEPLNLPISVKVTCEHPSLLTRFSDPFKGSTQAWPRSRPSLSSLGSRSSTGSSPAARASKDTFPLHLNFPLPIAPPQPPTLQVSA